MNQARLELLTILQAADQLAGGLGRVCMKHEIKLLVWLMLLAAVMGGCTLPIFGSQPEPVRQATASNSPLDLRWQKRTAEARQTRAVLTETLTATLPDPSATATYTATEPATQTVLPTLTDIPKTSTATKLVYTSTPTSISTPKPTLAITRGPTPIASFTPRPTITPLSTPFRPTATATKKIPCDQAVFVKDLNIKDGSIFPPGATFLKSWRLLNSGTCTWTTEYGIVFESGERMRGQSPKLFGVEVKPGETVDVSVELTAPSIEGSHRGNWMLRNAKGEHFGTIAAKADNLPFYVAITVQNAPTNYAVDFVSLLCDAKWKSGSGNLPCPGITGDPAGMAQRVDRPTLENGATDNEPALLTIPQAVTDGWIRGHYPWYVVENGDQFRTILFCAEDARTCTVKFKLEYILDGEETIRTMAAWDKVWDGSIHRIAIDLSSLAGKKVMFILTVLANGETRDNRAMWLAPRILHP